MPRNIDPEMLDKLLITIQESIPSVKYGIESFLIDNSRYGDLESSYGHMHPIRDVAEMLEISTLDFIASMIMEMMEDIAAEADNVNSESGIYLLESINTIEPYLRSLLSNDAQDTEIASKAIAYYRRFKNLPESYDQEFIKGMLLQNGKDITLDQNYIEDGDREFKNEPQKCDSNLDLNMDFSAELLEGFLIEAEDYLDIIGSLLPEITDQAEKNETLQQIRRSVHTLKGAAGVVGLLEVSKISHRMEDVLDDLYDGRLGLTPQIKETMLSTFDVLEDFIRDKRAQGDINSEAQNLYSLYDRILLVEDSDSDALKELNDFAPIITNEPRPQMVDFEDDERAEIYADELQAEVPKITVQQSEFVRVPIERLDEMVRLISELVISRSVFEQHLANLVRQVDELYLSIDRLQRTSTTIETQYEVSALIGGQSPSGSLNGSGLSRAGSEWTGIVEFDELEFDRYSDFHLMSRDLTETCADVGAIGTEFREIVSEFDAYLTRQSRLTSEAQDKLMHFRMIPLSNLSTRLQRAVRVTARQRNKSVNLILEGEDVQFDKGMLDELNEALLHILRNAVDHGIEAPKVREEISKPIEGVIHLKAYREGTQIVIKIRDDGAGLNPQRIRTKAIKNNLVSESEIETWSDDQLYSLIFSPGFSTAQEVSEVSGRGVGMDIVKDVITRLKGRINVESTLGLETTITIRLPLTLAVTQVLLIKVNGQVFAIPLADVIQVITADMHEIENFLTLKSLILMGKSFLYLSFPRH